MAIAAPIAINVGIADKLKAIDGILERREARQATVWESLADQLQAVSRPSQI